jgi:hypothetical protein
MALLTLAEMNMLSRYSPENRAINLGQRLSDASTLQCFGDSATSHARIATNPLAGDTVSLLAGSGLDRTGVFDVGSQATYEFTTIPDTVQTPGNVPVLIGATPTESTTNLTAAMQRTTKNAVVCEQHALNTTVVDVCHNDPGCTLTLSTLSGGRIIVQNNNEQLALDQYVFIIRRRVISAEDVSRGRLRFDTGWSQIVEGFASIYSSSTDQTANPYNGTKTLNAGILELSQGTASGTWSAGNVLQMILLGIR